MVTKLKCRKCGYEFTPDPNSDTSKIKESLENTERDAEVALSRLKNHIRVLKETKKQTDSKSVNKAHETTLAIDLLTRVLPKLREANTIIKVTYPKCGAEIQNKG